MNHFLSEIAPEVPLRWWEVVLGSICCAAFTLLVIWLFAFLAVVA